MDWQRRYQILSSNVNEEHNFIVRNEYFQGDTDINIWFKGESFKILDDSMDMWDVLVLAGIFTSRGQAKKDKRWGQQRAIPDGYTELLEVGKKRVNIFVVKPMKLD